MPLHKKILLIFLITFGLTNFSLPQTHIYVEKNSTINSIGKALSLAKDGDEIIVKSGIYYESGIVINKSIKLTGKDLPVISGDKKNEIFTITSDNVTITGFTIKNAGVNYLKENAAIRLSNVRNCRIEKNIFVNNFFGIYLSKSSNILIKNNKISSNGKSETSSGNGIHLWYSESVSIIGNEIEGHRDGIYFEFSKHCFVKNNYSKKNLRYGLHFMFSDSCSYIENTFENNGAGVAVMYTKNISMIGNRFINNWGAASFGVLLKDLTDCLIAKNIFDKNTNGLYLEGCSRITIEHNDFIQNGWALKLMANSQDNFFFENNFIANSFDVLTNSSQNFNLFKRNYWSNYNGYDLDKNGIGDEPYRPVKMFSVLVERQQAALILVHSLFIDLLDIAESVVPSLTPIDLVDKQPLMKQRS
ncbi:MAG: nitrous oxide reductase family maturation protein NosD [Ignavibacteriales bacterium]|nr:nitrous oxide reductase family maturation protein NosD [Ignavibacteriales bacterium]